MLDEYGAGVMQGGFVFCVLRCGQRRVLELTRSAANLFLWALKMSGSNQ